MQCPSCSVESDEGNFEIKGVVEDELELAFKCEFCGVERFVYVNQRQLERTTDKQEETSDDCWSGDGKDDV